MTSNHQIFSANRSDDVFCSKPLPQPKKPTQQQMTPPNELPHVSEYSKYPDVVWCGGGVPAERVRIEVMSKQAQSPVKPSRQAKIVFIGDAGVGKSSLVLRFVQNNWTPHLTSTIGAAFTTKTLRYDKDVVRWELWDTAGQEQYNSLVPMYYRGALGAVLVYDITSNASFGRLQKWVIELRSVTLTHTLTLTVSGWWWLI